MSTRFANSSVYALLGGLALVVLAAGVIRAVATGGVAGAGKTHLAFWNGFTGPDGIVMLQIVEQFNRENPDVQVVMQRIPWATYYNKLTVAGTDGRGPEVFICHADALARVRRTGLVDEVTDLYGPGGLDVNDFEPYVADYVDYSGHRMGVPLDIHPQGMYCNADVLKKAGIVGPDGEGRPPADKDEFLRAVKAATIDVPGKPEDKQWAFAFTYWGNNFRALVPQFGGHYLDAKGNSDMACPENVKALEFLGGIAKQKLAPPPDNGLGWVGFRTGKVAMVWDGVYMLGDLVRLHDFHYLGAPIPQIGDRPGTLANSHVLCIKHGLPAQTRDAAARFVKFVSDHSLTWAAAGQVPVRKSIRRRPEFQSMQVQAAFAKQVPSMLYPPRTPVIFEVMLQMDRAVESVVRGQAEPMAALKGADVVAQAAIDRDRVEHPGDAP